MHVKICGITALEDALAAVAAGADMLGFNFYPRSPRYLAPGQCARLTRALRSTPQGAATTLVGVFVNTDPPGIQAIVSDCGLDLVQLSGDEPPRVLAALAGKGFKAIRPGSLQEAMALASDCYGGLGPSAGPALLVDAHQPGHYGGSGRAGDLSLAAALAGRYPILLAGGLTPENVAAAVQRVRPWGVDVASGVESQPGRKDHRRMVDFVQAALGAVQEMR